MDHALHSRFFIFISHFRRNVFSVMVRFKLVISLILFLAGCRSSQPAQNHTIVPCTQQIATMEEYDMVGVEGSTRHVFVDKYSNKYIVVRYNGKVKLTIIHMRSGVSCLKEPGLGPVRMQGELIENMLEEYERILSQ